MAHEFRTFTVVKKVAESEIITSFYFQATDGAPLWNIKPGQYLTLKIPAENGEILKPYSLSCDASEAATHRITVKREAGLNGAPDGVGSCWLHDQLKLGDKIQIAPPRGSFFLDEQSNRPVLLLSGGVGLTPLVSMLHRLNQNNRDVYFFHACENGQVHALRDEVTSLTNERIKSVFIYRQPSAQDQVANRFDAQGVIDKTLLQQHIPIGSYDVYLCGPTPFMIAMYQLLLELGVRKDQIAYEFFDKAASLEKLAQTQAEATRSQAASAAIPAVAALPNLTNPDAWAEAEPDAASNDLTNDSSAGFAADKMQPGSAVTFSKSNKTASWEDSVDSLLELAENAGLAPEFSCRSGICSTCACKLVEGKVEYFEEPLERPDNGDVLICCAKPKGPVVLEI